MLHLITLEIAGNYRFITDIYWYTMVYMALMLFDFDVKSRAKC